MNRKRIEKAKEGFMRMKRENTKKKRKVEMLGEPASILKEGPNENIYIYIYIYMG